jgi:tripartite-type tricarboxylate transporter receptor subunit TctC
LFSYAISVRRDAAHRGGAAAATALLGGEAKFSFLPVPNVLPHIDAGKLKAFAVTSQNRFDGAPAIPTAIESGFPDLETQQWVGILVPAATPPRIAKKLNDDIVEIVQTPAFHKILQAQGAVSAPSTPAEFAAFIASETLRLRKLIEASGLQTP